MIASVHFFKLEKSIEILLLFFIVFIFISKIQYIRDDEIQVSQLKQFHVDYQIKSFAWLNARTIVMFDMSERAHVMYGNSFS